VNYIAKTYFGLEPVLTKELEAIGAQDITPLTRAVSFSGDRKLLYKANLHLRTALRILQPVFHFRARNPEDLYRKAMEQEWEKWISIDKTFMIDATVKSELFNHSRYAAQKLKDAIVDRFRKQTGDRPSIDLERPDIRLNLHINHNSVNISVDSSGEPLFKRGYREQRHKAPLSEVLAAGMVLHAAWNPKQLLINPMCGSGTIAIEAGLMATNTPPGMFRKHFAFMDWHDFDAELWNRLKAEAKQHINRSRIKIMASDADRRSIALAKAGAHQTGLTDVIQFETQDFEEIVPEAEEGTVIMNPPYGVRLLDNQINNAYKDIGNHLKRNFSGFHAWIISSNKDALKFVGLRPSRKITLYNGPLECKYQRYDLYSGSKKAKKNPHQHTGKEE